jgi:hypothetical protein
LTLYSYLEVNAVLNAIETRMEVLSVVPTLQAALEYTVLKHIVMRMHAEAETIEAKEIQP